MFIDVSYWGGGRRDKASLSLSQESLKCGNLSGSEVSNVKSDVKQSFLVHQ